MTWRIFCDGSLVISSPQFNVWAIIFDKVTLRLGRYGRKRICLQLALEKRLFPTPLIPLTPLRDQITPPPLCVLPASASDGNLWKRNKLFNSHRWVEVGCRPKMWNTNPLQKRIDAGGKGTASVLFWPRCCELRVFEMGVIFRTWKVLENCCSFKAFFKIYHLIIAPWTKAWLKSLFTEVFFMARSKALKVLVQKLCVGWFLKKRYVKWFCNPFILLKMQECS